MSNYNPYTSETICLELKMSLQIVASEDIIVQVMMKRPVYYLYFCIIWIFFIFHILKIGVHIYRLRILFETGIKSLKIAIEFYSELFVNFRGPLQVIKYSHFFFVASIDFQN